MTASRARRAAASPTVAGPASRRQRDRRKLELRGLVLREAELAGDRGVELRAAPLEDARELADVAVRDRERRPLVTDASDDDGRWPPPPSPSAAARRRAAAQTPRGRFRRARCWPPGTPRRNGRSARDRRPRARPAGDVPALVDRLVLDDVVVEDRLVHRDRERLVGAEGDRVPELALVVDALDLELRTPTRFVPIPSRTPLRGSLCCVKNSSSAGASAGDVADLAAHDDPGREGWRASWTSLAPPLFTTWAAASCDAPILMPTSSACFALARFARPGCRGPSALSACVFRLRSESLISFFKSTMVTLSPRVEARCRRAPGRRGATAQWSALGEPRRSSSPRSCSGRDERAKATRR